MTSQSFVLTDKAYRVCCRRTVRVDNLLPRGSMSDGFALGGKGVRPMRNRRPTPPRLLANWTWRSVAMHCATRARWPNSSIVSRMFSILGVSGAH